MNDMAEWRKRIDEIDRQILKLLNEGLHSNDRDDGSMFYRRVWPLMRDLQM